MDKIIQAGHMHLIVCTSGFLSVGANIFVLIILSISENEYLFW